MMADIFIASEELMVVSETQYIVATLVVIVIVYYIGQNQYRKYKKCDTNEK